MAQWCDSQYESHADLRYLLCVRCFLHEHIPLSHAAQSLSVRIVQLNLCNPNRLGDLSLLIGECGNFSSALPPIV